MIENYSDLFRNVTFDDCNVLDETTLMVIFKHVSKIEILEIAHQQIEVDAYTFDTIISSLKNAKSLTNLDFSGCPLSTLTFIPFLDSLESLNLSSTRIDNEELKYLNINNLKNLTHLYLSFNNLSMISILNVVEKMSIQFLDTCGIACTFENVVEITVLCPFIVGLHLTFATDADKMQSVEFIKTNFRDTIKLNCM